MPKQSNCAIADWIYTGNAHKSSDRLPNNTRSEFGYVYVIGKSPDGPTKLGMAENARKRVKGLEGANGEKFKLIWISKLCRNFSEIEVKAHERMARFRLHGEWFDLPFEITVRVAMDYPYKTISRYKAIEALREAANKAMPPVSTAPS